MKIIGRYVRALFDRTGQAEVTFLVKNLRHVGWLAELNEGTDYRLDINEVKSARSLQQNAYLWRLLHELAQVTQEDEWDWYLKALETTDAVHEYIWALEKTEDALRKSFRAVKRVKPHRIGETDGWLFKCYIGSSRFTTVEMSRLIDTVVQWCGEHNIDTDPRLYE